MSKELQAIPLQVAVLQITIRPTDKMHLGKYPAMTIRGGMGYALRKLACTCQVNEHSTNCLYAKLFEEKEGAMNGTLYIPYTRPFIIRTRENFLFSYSVNIPYTFELVLFGEAISHIDLFILAMKSFGERGIGEEKNRFIVDEVIEHRNGQSFMLYEKGSMIQKAKGTFPFVVSSVEMESDKLQLQFITPLRLQVDGNYMQHISMEVVVDNLIRRLRSLLYFHHGNSLVTDELAELLIEEAYKYVITAEQYKYVSYKRYSSRQKRQAPIDGIVGNITIEHVPKEIRKLLVACQPVHVGKQTVFGLGEYKVIFY